MKTLLWVGCLALVVAASFLAGSWSTQRGHSSGDRPASRKILYYVDPMHPAYKSDKPGIAPDCGMELVPVYEDGGMGGAAAGTSGPPGTVTIGAETRRLIGVKVATVSKAPIGRSLRVLGRVTAAEERTYRVIVGIDGWINDVSAVTTTGSKVTKGQALASLASPDAINPQLTYIATVNTLDRIPASVRAITGVDTTRSIAQRNKDTLRYIGMSEAQIEEVARTATPAETIRIVSPASGIVLARSVSAEQRVEKGAELFRIADLTRVWILADVLEDEGRHLRPGTAVTASVPQVRKTFRAKVSHVLPVFDGTTRTLKVRLEADNPGYLLRADMFVDIEVPVTREMAMVVPADAVVDAGLKKTVYVDKGDGVLEPRKVETGWRHGDQVEIVRGLMPGEQIVVSGTFLIDSESRMRAAAAGIIGETSTDPVCGMEIDQTKAKASGRLTVLRGETYYFCSDDCKDTFDKTPRKYTWKTDKGAITAAGKRLERVEWHEGETGDAHAHGDSRMPLTSAAHAGHQ